MQGIPLKPIISTEESALLTMTRWDGLCTYCENPCLLRDCFVKSS